MKPAGVSHRDSVRSGWLAIFGRPALLRRTWVWSWLAAVAVGIAPYWLYRSKHPSVTVGQTAEIGRSETPAASTFRSTDISRPRPRATLFPARLGETVSATHLPQIEFRGNRTIPTHELRKLLEGTVAGDGKQAVEIIREAYAAHGHMKAAVKVERLAGEPTAWTVEINEGPQYSWGNVEVTSETLPPRTIRALFPFQQGHTANLVELKSYLESFKKYVESQGYLDFSYVPEMACDETRSHLDICISLSEGRQYHVTVVSFNSPRVQEALSPLLGRPFAPSSLAAMLAKVGLTEKDIKIVIDRTTGTVILTEEPDRP